MEDNLDEDELSVMPVYRFEWSDGSSRTTDNIDAEVGNMATVVENLAALGRADDDCTVEVIGYAN